MHDQNRPYRLLRHVLDAYDAGEFASGELPGHFVEVALHAELEQQLDELDPDRADWVMWLLRDAYAPIAGHEPERYIIIEGVTIRPGHEDAYLADRARRESELRSVRVPAIRAWLAVRPLTTREEFPAELVRRVVALVAVQRNELLKEQPPILDRKRSRAWWRESGIDALVHLSIELDSALDRASRGRVGSQEQALAWDGLERIAADLVAVDGLDDADSQFLASARDRRISRLSDVRGGVELPCHRARGC